MFSAFSSAKKTVDGVMSAFKQTLEDLHEVQMQSKTEEAAQEQIIKDAIVAKEAARFEASRAFAVADQLQRLLGV